MEFSIGSNALSHEGSAKPKNVFVAAFDAGMTQSNQQRDSDVKIICFLPLVSITTFIITCVKYGTRDERNNGKFTLIMKRLIRYQQQKQLKFRIH